MDGNSETGNLYSEIFKEIKRVESLIPQYEAIGENGKIALIFIKDGLRRAQKILALNDPALLIYCLSELREFK